MRIIWMFITHLFRLPYLYFNFKKYTHKDKYDDETRYAFLRRMMPTVLRRGRVKLNVTGLENIPKEDGFICYPNHQGMFDVLCFIGGQDKRMVPLMKKENKGVPLLRDLIPIYNSPLIDREDVRQSMLVIKEMADRTKNGENFIIFAEGTRSRRGNLMGTMKPGAFKSATMAKCPIVPVALIDSGKPFDESSIRKVTVGVHFLPPLMYEDYKDMKTVEIAEVVTKMIKEKIAEVVPDTDPAKNPDYHIANAHITAEEEAAANEAKKNEAADSESEAGEK